MLKGQISLEIKSFSKGTQDLTSQTPWLTDWVTLPYRHPGLIFPGLVFPSNQMVHRYFAHTCHCMYPMKIYILVQQVIMCRGQNLSMRVDVVELCNTWLSLRPCWAAHTLLLTSQTFPEPLRCLWRQNSFNLLPCIVSSCRCGQSIRYDVDYVWEKLWAS